MPATQDPPSQRSPCSLTPHPERGLIPQEKRLVLGRKSMQFALLAMDFAYS